MQLLWKLPDVGKFRPHPVGLDEFGYPTTPLELLSGWTRPSPLSCRIPMLSASFTTGCQLIFESAYCGVPQVILPQWFDLYDNATRVEYLGIGECGCRSTAPKFNVLELEEAVRKVTTMGATDEDRRNLECCVVRSRGGLGRQILFLIKMDNRSPLPRCALAPSKFPIARPSDGHGESANCKSAKDILYG
ncbi:hypothetical protein BJ912DRAFT_930804 [Pholiota molesta]|nr:hypothetical protein BJ912DRAFT_930804 [Pholiota molesta]